jgi:hypothetical protein
LKWKTLSRLVRYSVSFLYMIHADILPVDLIRVLYEYTQI